MRSIRNYSRKRRGLRKSMRGGRNSLRRNSRKSLRRKGRKSLRRKSLRRRGRKSLRGGMENEEREHVWAAELAAQQGPLYGQTGRPLGEEGGAAVEDVTVVEEPEDLTEDADDVCEEDTGSDKITLLSELVTKSGDVMIDTWINKYNKLTSKVPFIDDAGETGSRKLTLYSKLHAKNKEAIDPILDELWRTGVQTITNRCGVNPKDKFPFSVTETEWIEAEGDDLEKLQSMFKDELYIMTRPHFHLGRGGGWGRKYYLYSNNFKGDEGYLYKLSFGHYPHNRGTAKRSKMQYIKKPTN